MMLPRWMAVVSYLATTFLLVNTTFHPAALLVFPGWILLVSGVLVVQASRHHATDESDRRPAAGLTRPSADGSPLPAQRSPDEQHDQP